jgi:hypothetical protein
VPCRRLGIAPALLGSALQLIRKLFALICTVLTVLKRPLALVDDPLRRGRFPVLPVSPELARRHGPFLLQGDIVSPEPRSAAFDLLLEAFDLSACGWLPAALPAAP